jgi:hypothetical protein
MARRAQRGDNDVRLFERRGSRAIPHTLGTADTFFRTWQSVTDSRVRRRDDPCSTDGLGLLESYGVRQTCERFGSSHLGEADPASYWP